MFGLGLPEIIVILIVALLVVGPSKLPDLAKSLGKAFSDFKRMADEVKETIEEAVVKEDAPKEEPAKEEAVKEEPAKEETAKTEVAKEEMPEGGSSDVEKTAKAEESWEHDVYGGYTESEESGQIADAGKVTQEEASGGDKKQTETKIKEA
jgi:Tat protein translocase TatB subunit